LQSGPKKEVHDPSSVENQSTNASRLHGTDAIKSHILAAKTVSAILKTSLGPRGRFPFFKRVTDFSRIGQDSYFPWWWYHGYERWCYHLGTNAGWTSNCKTLGSTVILIMRNC
jgi:hypothetical protein